MAGCVYFLQVDDLDNRPVKIGYTERDVRVRVREWQRQMPFHRLRLLGHVCADRGQETFLKNVFRGSMIATPGHGLSEWFNPTEQLLDYIDRATRSKD
jgi:hypothetical protein